MTDCTSMSMRNELEIITRGNYASDFKIQILKGFMDETDLNDKGYQRERQKERKSERERKKERGKEREREIHKERECMCLRDMEEKNY